MEKLTIETTIPYRGRRVKVNPQNPPKDTRQLRGFLLWNGANDCFMKGEGGWYKICKDGTIKYVVRALYLLSLAEFLEIAKDDNFIANMKD